MKESSEHPKKLWSNDTIEKITSKARKRSLGETLDGLETVREKITNKVEDGSLANADSAAEQVGVHPDGFPKSYAALAPHLTPTQLAEEIEADKRRPRVNETSQESARRAAAKGGATTNRRKKRTEAEIKAEATWLRPSEPEADAEDPLNVPQLKYGSLANPMLCSMLPADNRFRGSYYERDYGDVQGTVYVREGEVLPHGGLPRVLIGLILSRALYEGTPQVPLGHSWTELAREVYGIPNPSGRQIKRLQAELIALTHTTYRLTRSAWQAYSGLAFTPLEAWDLWGLDAEGEIAPGWVRVSPQLWEQTQLHTIRYVLTEAISLAGNATSLDVYMQLKYLANRLKKTILLDVDRLASNTGLLTVAEHKRRQTIRRSLPEINAKTSLNLSDEKTRWYLSP